MALREIFDVSGGADIILIAKAQGKTNLKQGAYLRQPMAYSLTSRSHMRTPGQWEWRSKSTKFQIHSTSQICNSATETGTSSKGPLHKEDTLSQLDQ